jgi:hypothetical protein
MFLVHGTIVSRLAAKKYFIFILEIVAKQNLFLSYKQS